MGSNTPKKTRAATTSADRTLIDGLGKHEAAIPSMVIAGQLLTTKDVVAVVQSRVDACAAAISTKSAWLAALEAEAGRLARTDAFISGVKKCLLVAFDGRSDALADFGLTPRKPRVDSPDMKLAAAAKARATRVARHTMGPRQKKAITGDAASAQVISTTAPAAAETAHTS